MIDPHDPTHRNRPLWCVYGAECAPQIMCCKILKYADTDDIIWGFSVYKGKPGFRTLGLRVDDWMHDLELKYGWDMFEFYDNHDDAIDRIREMTCPVYQTLANGEPS